ncbi:tetratricopeptide repeat protein [Corallococcus interemptor]|uniref:tetratricopeptide repeat protein n=1 Tax=Corallococcus TaxID=83461 RepID=UPI001CBBE940|nr:MULTISPECIES: tetratricopeptide repeat protein [unclassified Corallococcus]MBZ4330543.1 tetratricopeptide repeat protein [Corallococcus sp. AS-1-12]MBZ4370092.1 tetratricopeptide repeat protein [Corallococcus sp. AS-1-6]
MSLSLVLATTALLAAEPTSLPPGHPTIPPGTQASPAGMGAGANAATGALPPGHPTMPAGSPVAPGTPLPSGHPTVDANKLPPSAEELMKQLDSSEGLREREKTFEIASSLGKLYYTNGRNAEALAYLGQAQAKADGVRSLFLASRKKLGKAAIPTPEAANCGFTPGQALDAMAAVAQARAKSGDTAGAAACAGAALVPAVDVDVLMGNALYLGGDSAKALKAYERVLEVEPQHEEALYAHSSLLFETQGENLPALGAARQGFDALVQAHPNSQRAPMARELSVRIQEIAKAGGRKKWLQSRAEDRKVRLSQSTAQAAAMPPDAPRPLTPEMVDAVKNTERTPELEAGLTKLVEEGEEHLARGRYQEALANYTRVVPFQPENGRAKAGMAWALVGLGRPMGARVWSVALESDAGAVEKLGDTLLAKGDAKGARALWEKLAQDVPNYPNKAALQAKLSQ